MAQAGRVGDLAQRSGDAQMGGSAAGGSAAGEGSPDVIINGRAALRVGDPGAEKGSDGAAAWRAHRGSTGVLINGRPAFRHGDETAHAGVEGELVEGSPDVFFGEARGAKKQRPHDRSVTLEVTDALGRPIHDVVVSVFCPHEPREDVKVDGSTSVSGLCSGAMVTVHKPLQAGTWDEGVAPPSAHAHHHHHVASADASGASGGAAANDSGGAAADDSGGAAPNASGGAAAKVIIHAPAPAASAPAQKSIPLVQPPSAATVKLTTVHNWVELVYRAFGHHLPTGPMELALLGVREASLRAAAPGAHLSVDTLEKDADAGDLADVSFTREHRAPAYNDLLFCVWTDKTVHHRQHVEVFECTIDASPAPGLLHLPFLLEGQIFHAKPGPYDKHFPGNDIALHVFHGMKEHHDPPGATAEQVIAVAMKERGQTEHPPYSNRQKYGAWYGDNGQFWCAQFVSWVFAHAGMPQIHYEGCSLGAGMFQNGSWGTWHGGPGSHAEPGDIVFFDFPGEQKYDHTGIVVKDHGSYLTTIEGNTSPPGSSGSQSNGGGVYLKTRPKDSTIIGFGRPRFHKPHTEPGSFIRWGGEGAQAQGKSFRNSTVLHHHYFKTDHHGHKHPDPAAERYRRFMHLYNHAANKKAIPYLIASTRYLKTYAEWVAWTLAHPSHAPGARSVILESGLQSPKGHAHRYVPSFLSKAYADRVLSHVHHMHDHHKAAQLRAALEGCLLTLSI
jgi:uncharacterized Zn-binding protein involved in type VI secretion